MTAATQERPLQEPTPKSENVLRTLTPQWSNNLYDIEEIPPSEEVKRRAAEVGTSPIISEVEAPKHLAERPGKLKSLRRWLGGILTKQYEPEHYEAKHVKPLVDYEPADFDAMQARMEESELRKQVVGTFRQALVARDLGEREARRRASSQEKTGNFLGTLRNPKFVPARRAVTRYPMSGRPTPSRTGHNPDALKPEVVVTQQDWN